MITKVKKIKKYHPNLVSTTVSAMSIYIHINTKFPRKRY
jgi:hypothetical protein